MQIKSTMCTCLHLFVHALTLNISLLYLHCSGNTKKFYIHHLPGILISLKQREGGGKEEERLCTFLFKYSSNLMGFFTFTINLNFNLIVEVCVRTCRKVP